MGWFRARDAHANDVSTIQQIVLNPKLRLILSELKTASAHVRMCCIPSLGMLYIHVFPSSRIHYELLGMHLEGGCGWGF